MSKRALLSTVLFLVFFTFSCSTSQKVKREASRKKTPAWISKLPMDRKYVYVKGVSSNAETLQEAKEIARKSALSQLSDFIGIKVESSLKIKESTEVLSPEIDEEIKTESAAFISKMEVVDEYYLKTERAIGSLYEESFEFYMLCRFPRVEAEKERGKQAENNESLSREALKFYLDAQKKMQAGFDYNVYSSISSAARSMKNVPGNITLPENGASIANSGELRRKIDDFLSKLGVVSKAVSVSVTMQRPGSRMLFSANFGKALGEKKYSVVGVRDSARFELTINISAKSGEKVFGKNSMYAVCVYSLKDRWKNVTVATGSEEGRGFHAATSHAFDEALKEAGSVTGIKIAEKIDKYVLETK